MRTLLPPTSRRVALTPDPPTDSRFGCPCSVVHANVTTAAGGSVGPPGGGASGGPQAASGVRLGARGGGAGRAFQTAGALPSGGVRLWHTASFEGGDAAHFEWEDGKKKVRASRWVGGGGGPYRSPCAGR